MMGDTINGVFEGGGALLLILNINRLIKDKKVSGISLFPVIFFSIWELYWLWYYPTLKQWCSFVGAAALLLSNTVWVALALYYSHKNRKISCLDYKNMYEGIQENQ